VSHGIRDEDRSIGQSLCGLHIHELKITFEMAAAARARARVCVCVCVCVRSLANDSPAFAALRTLCVAPLLRATCGFVACIFRLPPPLPHRTAPHTEDAADAISRFGAQEYADDQLSRGKLGSPVIQRAPE